jgi:hypothetical protein
MKVKIWIEDGTFSGCKLLAESKNEHILFGGTKSQILMCCVLPEKYDPNHKQRPGSMFADILSKRRQCRILSNAFEKSFHIVGWAEQCVFAEIENALARLPPSLGQNFYPCTKIFEWSFQFINMYENKVILDMPKSSIMWMNKYLFFF